MSQNDHAAIKGIWNFIKDDQQRSCESRETTLWYELVITSPDGTKRVERYTDREGLFRRQRKLMCGWQEQGWTEIDAQNKTA